MEIEKDILIEQVCPPHEGNRRSYMTPSKLAKHILFYVLPYKVCYINFFGLIFLQQLVHFM